MSRYRTEDNYAEDAQVNVQEAADVAPAVKPSRDNRKQIELDKANKQKKRDLFEERILNAIEGDKSEETYVELAFAAHSKRMYKYLDADQIDDCMEAIQRCVDESVHAAKRGGGGGAHRAPVTSTAPNAIYHNNNQQGGGMMELMRDEGMPPMPGPAAHQVPYYGQGY